MIYLAQVTTQDGEVERTRWQVVHAVMTMRPTSHSETLRTGFAELEPVVQL